MIKWKPLVGYEELYRISSIGDVFSLRSLKMLKKTINHKGYIRYQLYKNGKTINIMAHRAVLLAFIGPCPPGMQCGHLDGNPANNKLTNLKWVTPLENARHKIRHGTHQTRTSKLTDRDVIDIKQRYVRTGRNASNSVALSKEFGVAQRTILSIISGEIWGHIKIKRKNGNLWKK